MHDDAVYVHTAIQPDATKAVAGDRGWKTVGEMRRLLTWDGRRNSRSGRERLWKGKICGGGGWREQGGTRLWLETDVSPRNIIKGGEICWCWLKLWRHSDTIEFTLQAEKAWSSVWASLELQRVPYHYAGCTGWGRAWGCMGCSS